MKRKAKAPRAPVSGWPAGRPVQVEWVDACTIPGWASAKQATTATGQVQYSVGFFLSVDKEFLRILMTQAEWNDDVGNVKIIPRNNVISVMRMRPGPLVRRDKLEKLRPREVTGV